MANTAAGTHIAIVSSHDVHPAITAGQFVYVKNSDLAEGIYTAKSNIAANAALSTSNLKAVSGGGLNMLNDNMKTKPFQYEGYVSSGSANNLSDGVTYVTADIAMLPVNVGGFILQMSRPGNSIVQLFISGRSGYQGHIYKRTCDNGTWQSWYDFSGTVVS